MAATDTLTKGEYNAAIDKLDAIYGDDADALMSMIATTRDDELFHDREVTGGNVHSANVECTDDCVGCMTMRIADVVTRAVSGKAA